MEIEEKQIELIEKYLADQMDPDERIHFESQIAADENLRLVVDQVKAIKDASRAQQLNQKLQLLQSIDASSKGSSLKTKNSPWKRMRLIGIAACILAITGIGYCLFPKPQSELLEKHLFVLDFPSERDDFESALAQAATFYDLESYGKAAPLIETAVADGAEEYHLIYAALSYLMDRKYQKADEILQRLEEKKYLPKWHIHKIRTLSLIGQKKTQPALKYLEGLHSNGELPPELNPLFEDLKKLSSK